MQSVEKSKTLLIDGSRIGNLYLDNRGSVLFCPVRYFARPKSLHFCARVTPYFHSIDALFVPIGLAWQLSDKQADNVSSQ